MELCYSEVLLVFHTSNHAVLYHLSYVLLECHILTFLLSLRPWRVDADTNFALAEVLYIIQVDVKRESCMFVKLRNKSDCFNIHRIH